MENVESESDMDVEDHDEFILHEKLKCTVCDFGLNSITKAYKILSHPILTNVPVCLICYDEINSKLMKDGNECLDENICSWCGLSNDEDDIVFLCDSEGCPRCYCEECLSRNFGQSMVDQMFASPNEPWYCPKCNPSMLEDYHTAFDEGQQHSIYNDSIFETNEYENPSEEQISKELDILSLIIDEVDTGNKNLESDALAKCEEEIKQELLLQ